MLGIDVCRIVIIPFVEDKSFKLEVRLHVFYHTLYMLIVTIWVVFL